jgi:hypothetical protein
VERLAKFEAPEAEQYRSDYRNYYRNYHHMDHPVASDRIAGPGA